MTRPLATPPVLATRILGSLLPEFSRDAILGDMHETFAQIAAEQGTAAAARWYWREALAALPGFALHSLNTTRSRRQIVNGNIWNENWFGKQDSRLAAGIGFVLVLPALLAVGLAVLFVIFGKPFIAGVNSIPAGAQFLAGLETGYIVIGGVSLPLGIVAMGGLGVALLINLLAVVKINIETIKDNWRFTFTVKRQPWSIILLALIMLLGLGMDRLIS
jgi:hypothetical protein